MTNAKGKRIINTQSHWLRNRGRQGCWKRCIISRILWFLFLISLPVALSLLYQTAGGLSGNECYIEKTHALLWGQLTGFYPRCRSRKYRAFVAETWWSHGGQVFAANDIHEKEMSCERRRALDGWYCVLGHRAPPLHTHAHPCLFAEGISCWNITIAMQSVPQLPDVPIDVQGWEMQDVLAYVTVTTRLRNSK